MADLPANHAEHLARIFEHPHTLTLLWMTTGAVVVKLFSSSTWQTIEQTATQLPIEVKITDESQLSEEPLVEELLVEQPLVEEPQVTYDAVMTEEDLPLALVPAPNIPVPVIWGHPNSISYTPSRSWNQALTYQTGNHHEIVHTDPSRILSYLVVSVFVPLCLLAWLIRKCCFGRPSPTTSAPSADNRLLHNLTCKEVPANSRTETFPKVPMYSMDSLPPNFFHDAGATDNSSTSTPSHNRIAPQNKASSSPSPLSKELTEALNDVAHWKQKHRDCQDVAFERLMEMERFEQELIDRTNDLEQLKLAKSGSEVTNAQESTQRIVELEARLKDCENSSTKLTKELERSLEYKELLELDIESLNTKQREISEDNNRLRQEAIPLRAETERLAQANEGLAAQHAKVQEGLTAQIEKLQSEHETKLEKNQSETKELTNDFERLQDQLADYASLNRQLRTEVEHLKTKAVQEKAAAEEFNRQKQEEFRSALQAQLTKGHVKNKAESEAKSVQTTEKTGEVEQELGKVAGHAKKAAPSESTAKVGNGTAIATDAPKPFTGLGASKYSQRSKLGPEAKTSQATEQHKQEAEQKLEEMSKPAPSASGSNVGNGAAVLTSHPETLEPTAIAADAPKPFVGLGASKYSQQSTLRPEVRTSQAKEQRTEGAEQKLEEAASRTSKNVSPVLIPSAGNETADMTSQAKTLEPTVAATDAAKPFVGLGASKYSQQSKREPEIKTSQTAEPRTQETKEKLGEAVGRASQTAPSASTPSNGNGATDQAKSLESTEDVAKPFKGLGTSKYSQQNLEATSSRPAFQRAPTIGVSSVDRGSGSEIATPVKAKDAKEAPTLKDSPGTEEDARKLATSKHKVDQDKGSRADTMSASSRPDGVSNPDLLATSSTTDENRMPSPRIPSSYEIPKGMGASRYSSNDARVPANLPNTSGPPAAQPTLNTSTTAPLNSTSMGGLGNSRYASADQNLSKTTTSTRSGAGTPVPTAHSASTNTRTPDETQSKTTLCRVCGSQFVETSQFGLHTHHLTQCKKWKQEWSGRGYINKKNGKNSGVKYPPHFWSAFQRPDHETAEWLKQALELCKNDGADHKGRPLLDGGQVYSPAFAAQNRQPPGRTSSQMSTPNSRYQRSPLSMQSGNMVSPTPISRHMGPSPRSVRSSQYQSPSNMVSSSPASGLKGTSPRGVRSNEHQSPGAQPTSVNPIVADTAKAPPISRPSPGPTSSTSVSSTAVLTVSAPTAPVQTISVQSPVQRSPEPENLQTEQEDSDGGFDSLHDEGPAPVRTAPEPQNLQIAKEDSDEGSSDSLFDEEPEPAAESEEVTEPTDERSLEPQSAMLPAVSTSATETPISATAPAHSTSTPTPGSANVTGWLDEFPPGSATSSRLNPQSVPFKPTPVNSPNHTAAPLARTRTPARSPLSTSLNPTSVSFTPSPSHQAAAPATDNADILPDETEAWLREQRADINNQHTIQARTLEEELAEDEALDAETEEYLEQQEQDSIKSEVKQNTADSDPANDRQSALDRKPRDWADYSDDEDLSSILEPRGPTSVLAASAAATPGSGSPAATPGGLFQDLRALKKRSSALGSGARGGSSGGRGGALGGSGSGRGSGRGGRGGQGGGRGGGMVKERKKV